MTQLLPRFRQVPRLVPRSKDCRCGKYGYETESDALEGLRRVRNDRRKAGDQAPWECRVYKCREGEAWHLTSNDTLHLGDVAPLRQGGGEPIEAYVKRLEKRIAQQRSEILSLHALGAGLSTNRATRQRIAGQTATIARLTELWQQEVRNREALVARLGRRSWWRRRWPLSTTSHGPQAVAPDSSLLESQAPDA